MRSGTSSLSVLFLLGAACSQIIGLSDYDKVGDPGSSGNTSSGGSTNTGGGANRGGRSTGEAGGGAGGVGEGGTGTGGSGDAGAGASNEGGRMTTGGRSSGGTVGNGGSNDGGAGDNAGGVSGEGGVGGDGGTTTGGTAGKGGSGGAGGTSKGGGGGTLTGGTGGTSGGKGGSGGVSPPTGGKGGSGGTTGGSPGSGGKGGTCSQQELLTNPNFDSASAVAWVQGSSEDYTMLLNASQISDAPVSQPVTPLSGSRAAVLGGVGPAGDEGYSYVGQPVTIPVGASQLRLACSRQVRTDETLGTAYDYLDAWLWDDGMNDVAHLFEEWSNLDAVSTWTSFAYTVDAASLAGNTYTFEFFALYDDQDETWFFIDNCSLQATVCN